MEAMTMETIDQSSTAMTNLVIFRGCKKISEIQRALFLSRDYNSCNFGCHGAFGVSGRKLVREPELCWLYIGSWASSLGTESQNRWNIMGSYDLYFGKCLSNQINLLQSNLWRIYFTNTDLSTKNKVLGWVWLPWPTNTQFYQHFGERSTKNSHKWLI